MKTTTIKELFQNTGLIPTHATLALVLEKHSFEEHTLLHLNLSDFNGALLYFCESKSPVRYPLGRETTWFHYAEISNGRLGRKDIPDYDIRQLSEDTVVLLNETSSEKQLTTSTQTNNKMKILVLEDDPKQQDAAHEQLEDHECIIVTKYDDAFELLKVKNSRDKALSRLQEKYSTDDFKQLKKILGEVSARKVWKQAWEDVAIYPDFDAVLTDLFVPTYGCGIDQRTREEIGQIFPLGTALALMALENKVKLVGILTDTNHHRSVFVSALSSLKGTGFLGKSVFGFYDCYYVDKAGIKQWKEALNELLLLQQTEEV